MNTSTSMNSLSGMTSLPRIESCNGLDTVEREGQFEGVRVRVYLWNKEEKVLFFKNYDLTAQQICNEMAKKELLAPESKPYFALWIVGNNLELQLKPTQDVFEVVEKFPRYVEKYTHFTGKVQWRFYFKREAMLSKTEERKIKDPSAIKLLYSEALYNVISSRYPCEEESVITLAALQLQIVYGDIKPEVHKADFLVNKKFKGFFPRNMIDSLTARLKFADWEARVLEEYEKLSGKPEMIAQLLYLQHVRQWPFYGSTFFISCLEVPPKGYFEHRTETLYITVNAEGIHIIDADKVKLLHTFSYDEIIWDATKDTVTIEYGPDEDLKELTFITPQGSLIASLVAKAIRNLDKHDRRLSTIRKAQSSDSL